MERSDKYIEELESELKTYRDSKTGSDKGGKQVYSRGEKYLPNGDHVTRKVSSDSKVLPSTDFRERAANSSRKQLFSEDKVSSKSSSGEGSSKYYYLSNGDAGGGEEHVDYEMDYEMDKNYERSESARSGAGKGQKRVTFNLRHDTNATTSFDLELPSPVKTSGNRSTLGVRPGSPVKGVLKNGVKKSGANDKSDDTLSGSHSRTYDDSLSNSYNEKPSKRSELYSKDDDLVYMKARAKSKESGSEGYAKSRRKYSADDSALSEPSDSNSKIADDLLKRSSDLVKRASDLERYSSGTGRSSDYNTNTGRSSSDYNTKPNDDSDDIDRVDLDDTIHIESELGELDISLTPELSDCMKLLNRAEKKVHHRDSDPEDDDITGYKSRRTNEVDMEYKSSGTRTSDIDNAYRASTSRISGIDSDFRPSSLRDSDMDNAFRASTGSYNSRLRADDLSSDYKSGIESKFTASLDTYSRGRHHRSGSLDNLLVDVQREPVDRPASALPSTSNMYSGLPSSKYAGGLTTGRTKLTRSPSYDNLISRQDDGFSSKYSVDTDFSGAKSRLSMPGYLSQRPYRGENVENLDVKASTGMGSTDFAGLDKAITKGMESRGEGVQGGGNRADFEALLEARAKSLSDVGTTASHVSGRQGLDIDSDRRTYHTVRPSSVQDGEMNMDIVDRKRTSGRTTPTLTAPSNYDKLTHTGPGASSGRLTPNLPLSTNLNPHSKTNFTNYDYTGSGPSSLPADISHKPPIAGRPYESSRLSLGTGGATSASSHSSVPSVSSASGKGYSSMPNYPSTSGPSFPLRIEHVPSRPGYNPELGPSSKTNHYDAYQPDLDNYVSTKQKPNIDGRLFEDKFSATSAPNANNLPVYNANRVDIESYNYNSHEYSSKMPSVDQNAPKPVLSASDNLPSALPSFTGSSSLASYAATSFLPTSLNSMSAGSSYSTAISVPLTLTTSSYSSSRPSTSYPSTKTMDPISEHYSYVSNFSGDLSKSDTFALPEPKKRLFDSTDDLDMSVSPIKSNKRY